MTSMSWGEVRNMLDALQGLDIQAVETIDCPMGCRDSVTQTPHRLGEFDLAMHLNDIHKFLREEIADYLDEAQGREVP